MELRAGTQVFKLKEKIGSMDVKWLRIEILKNHDHAQMMTKTYINQIMLYDQTWIDQEKRLAMKNMISEYSSQVNIGKIVS